MSPILLLSYSLLVLLINLQIRNYWCYSFNHLITHSWFTIIKITSQKIQRNGKRSCHSNGRQDGDGEDREPGRSNGTRFGIPDSRRIVPHGARPFPHWGIGLLPLLLHLPHRWLLLGRRTEIPGRNNRGMRSRGTPTHHHSEDFDCGFKSRVLKWMVLPVLMSWCCISVSSVASINVEYYWVIILA